MVAFLRAKLTAKARDELVIEAIVDAFTAALDEKHWFCHHDSPERAKCTIEATTRSQLVSSRPRRRSGWTAYSFRQ